MFYKKSHINSYNIQNTNRNASLTDDSSKIRTDSKASDRLRIDSKASNNKMPISNNNQDNLADTTGYLSFCIMSSSTSELYTDFVRKYFCISYKTKELTYYASEDHYIKAPSQTESPRPIRISEYIIDDIDEFSIPYKILLKDSGDRGSIEFMCDTFEDLQRWSDAFRLLCTNIVRDSDDEFASRWSALASGTVARESGMNQV